MYRSSDGWPLEGVGRGSLDGPVGLPTFSRVMQEILLLHVTGEDRPGLTALLTGVLAGHDIDVLDLNQTVIHRTLLLGMLIRIGGSAESTRVLKDVLFAAHHAGLSLRITPVDDAEYDAWVSREGAARHILTLLARRLTATHISEVSSLLAEQGLNIDIITRLSGRPPRSEDGRPRRACVELSIRGQPADEAALRARLMDISQRHPVDIAWQRDGVYRRMRRLVAFDMDSTLIQHEVIDELAREAGVHEQVSAITGRGGAEAGSRAVAAHRGGRAAGRGASEVWV
jgi:phosphoserine phosphatase